MPELPEVETIRRMLDPKLAGRKITGCNVLLARMLKNVTPELFCAVVSGRTISRLERRGKFLLLMLDDGVIVIHLRMTGRLKVRRHNEQPDKYSRVELVLDDENVLQYADTRTLGTVHWFADETAIDISCLTQLGPEPFESTLSGGYFGRKLDGSRRNIKAFLLDQSFIAGLGNIYVDEALHTAGILPQRLAGSLDAAEREALYAAILAVIEKAVKNCGTSFRDYVDGEGNKGHNQDELQVYGRKGARCFRCGNAVEYGRVAGRGTHWCGQCQK